MRHTRFHAKAQMTRAQNRTAFTMWLAGASDAALSGADAVSLSRSYGIDAVTVAKEIRDALHRRSIAARIQGTGQ